MEDVQAKSFCRKSNLELYRIVLMFLIVAHHYVFNSGLTSADGPLVNNPNSVNTDFLWLLGMWGKTSINSFLLITGYFMCTSKITIQKFTKFILQIYFYKIIILLIFIFFSDKTFTVIECIKQLMPTWGLTTNFVGCYLVFYFTIPFLNILINNMKKSQFEMLLCLLLGIYTICGSIPTFGVAINYVTWFGVVYLIGAYIRLYPYVIFKKTSFWLLCTLISITILCFISICFDYTFSLFLLSDSNKFFAVFIAISSFLLFKNMNIGTSKTINTVASSTFGILLIHANSNEMRQWLWGDVVDCVGHYSLPFFSLVLYSLGSIILIFCLCSIIDICRIYSIEKNVTKYLKRIGTVYEKE